MIKAINVFTVTDHTKIEMLFSSGDPEILWATNTYLNPEVGGNNILLL